MWTLLATAAKSSRTRAGGGSTRRTSKLAPGTALLYSFSCHAQWKDGSSKRSITCFCEWTARISQATKLQWLSPLVSPSESGHANGSQARHSERAEKNKKRSTNKETRSGCVLHLQLWWEFVCQSTTNWLSTGGHTFKGRRRSSYREWVVVICDSLIIITGEVFVGGDGGERCE